MVWSAAGTIAQAVQPAIHDVTDGSVMRSWLNSPLSSGLEQDVYKATNILHTFAQVGYLQPEKGIPAAVLQGAAGFAILSVVKVTPINHKLQLQKVVCNIVALAWVGMSQLDVLLVIKLTSV